MNTKLLKDKASAVFAVIAVVIQRIATSKPVKAAFKWCHKHRLELLRHAVVVAVAVTLCLLITNRVKAPPAEAKALVPEATEIAEVTPEPTPTVNMQYRAEAEAVARVLYGIRDNSLRDQRTYVWCIFNRVDNPSREFANTLTEVIGKPDQWMFYSESNPVLEIQYQLALTEVIIWHEGHRPVSCDWVFAVWSGDKIYLTKEIGGAEHWQYPES